MLDKADFIARYDRHGTLEATMAQVDRLMQPVAISGDATGRKPIRSIVCSAMGGSALPAEFMRGWLFDRLPCPIEIVRGYELPAYVDETSLVVCGSYSGSTEETVAAFRQAIKQRAQIVVISGGGKLLEMAKAEDVAFIELPPGLFSGQAIWAGIGAWATVLEQLKLADNLVFALDEAAKWMKAEVTSWAAEKTTEGNIAKQLAVALVAHPVVVYAGPILRYAAKRWKIAINEFGKNIAFAGEFPEINHNEMSGWKLPVSSGMKVVELRSSMDGERMRQRIEITNRLLSSAFAPIEVTAEGQDKLRQMMWTSLLGEMTGVYLGILNQVDPAALPVVDTFKTQLGKL